MTKKYGVMLEGRGFLLDMKGSVQKYGFFTTRYIEADSPEQAEIRAVQLIRQDKLIKSAAKNEGSRPMIYVDSITELKSFEGSRRPGTRYRFFPDTSD